MFVRITIMVLRLCVLLAIILGIIFWTGNETETWVNIHMLLGILVVLSLWTLAIVQGMAKGGNWGLAAGAIVLGLIVAGFGMTQRSLLPTPNLHWIIQVIHLLLGLSAAGLGEMLAGRYKRLKA